MFAQQTISRLALFSHVGTRCETKTMIYLHLICIWFRFNLKVQHCVQHLLLNISILFNKLFPILKTRKPKTGKYVEEELWSLDTIKFVARNVACNNFRGGTLRKSLRAMLHRVSEPKLSKSPFQYYFFLSLVLVLRSSIVVARRSDSLKEDDLWQV